VYGIDVGAQRRRLVVSRESGVEVFSVATGLRLGNDLSHPAGRLGRGVAVEDEVDGGASRYAYVLVTDPGQFRAVDLDADPPEFEEAAAVTFFPVVSGGLAPIPGTPVDIEVRPGAVDYYAYVTSVEDPTAGGGLGPEGFSTSSVIIEPDPGGGPGGGGGCNDRRTMLSVLKTDRANGFASANVIQTIQLSCIDPALRPPGTLEEIGAAWNAAQDKLYVVVPDLDGVKVFTPLTTGQLDAVNVEFISTGKRPTDVVLAKLKIAGLVGERVVTSHKGIASCPEPPDPTYCQTGPPSLHHFLSASPAVQSGTVVFEANAVPAGISAHPDLSNQLEQVIVIADRGRKEIRVQDIRDLLIPRTLYRIWAFERTPSRVTIQGQ
jgi:hypothetical protein